MDVLKHLDDIDQKPDRPWLILGDFNCIGNLNERMGSTLRLTETLPLRQCKENCGLYNVKSNGRFYTWNNKQAGHSWVMSKIDTVMANQQWEEAFPNVEVTFHSEGDFDHTPMIVYFFNPIKTRKPFKFYNHWGKQVHSIWSNNICGHLTFQILNKQQC